MSLDSQPTDRLIHIADLHFWHVVANPLRLLSKRFVGNLNVWLRRRREFIMGRAEAFAEHVAETGIPLVLMTGDFTSTANREEYRRAQDFVYGLHRRGLCVELLPGNHDVYTFRTARSRYFEAHFGEFVPEEGYPALRRLPGGTPLILAPTATPNLISSKGRITDPEVAQVAALLDACDGPVIVAGHYPILPKTYAYTQHASHRLRNAEALRAALGRSRRRVLYVCGHTHRFSYVRDAEFPNVSHLSTGAFFRLDETHGLQGEFSEVHVAPAGFEVFHHTCADGWQRQDAAIHD